MRNPIDDLVERDARIKESLFQQLSYDNLPEYEYWRHLRKCIPPAKARADPISIERAREMINQAINQYNLLSNQQHMLLIKALPGIGKTYACVEIAERCALFGNKVAYAAPRHDFYADVMAIAKYPELWYEWLPRQKGDIETCQYADEISSWLFKGYEAMDFCSGVCGWDYINHGCPYHAQKRTRKTHPITFIQHAHVALGHPLEFDVMIGDENPIGAFLHKWRIPARAIVPSGMMSNNPITNILNMLTGLAASDKIVEGEELLEYLGGAQSVLDAFLSSTVPADALPSGTIHSLVEAEHAGYFHLPKLSYLLQREARLALAGKKYIHRLIAGRDGITMLLRHNVNDNMPTRKIWLDATGGEDIYRTLFQQPVQVVDISPQMTGKITVVTDRANGKGLFKNDRDKSRRVEQINNMINHIIEIEHAGRVGVVSFQGLITEDSPLAEGKEVLNFYGARGTNRLENVDVLFVIGTPMPEQSIYKSMGAMLYFDRDEPFNDKWTSRWIPYNYRDADGSGMEYPAGGFWGDRDLQALLWQMREAEIIQAVHRARPLLYPVKIYLLTNLPILDLHVDELINTQELYDVPEGIDRYRWAKFYDWMEHRDEVTTSDIIQLFEKMKPETARKYLQIYVENNPDWTLAAVKTGKRGKPPLAARRGIMSFCVN